VCLLTVKQDYLPTSDGAYRLNQMVGDEVSGGRREGSFLRRLLTVLVIYNTMCYLCAFSLSSRMTTAGAKERDQITTRTTLTRTTLTRTTLTRTTFPRWGFLFFFTYTWIIVCNILHLDSTSFVGRYSRDS
jgi:hypothetical protein